MEIRTNRVKQKLADGDLAYVISGLTNADDIDIFGPNGFDGVWLEGEHGAVDTRMRPLGHDFDHTRQSQRSGTYLPHA